MVDPCNAACRVIARDPPLGSAAADNPRSAVHAYDATDCVTPADSPLKGTVPDRAVIHTADAPDTFLLVLSLDVPLQGQILDDTVALHIAEQADHIPVTKIVKPGDRVAHAVKDPIEHRNDGDLCPCQVDVRLQAHIFVP